MNFEAAHIVTIEANALAQDAEALSRGIRDFNHDEISDLEPESAEFRFHVIAKTGDNVVVGGIRASCYWNTLHIELLWLGESVRGSGLGRRILQKAEATAMAHKCEIAFVETTSWQAKPFYEKCGYTCIATLKGRPKGYSSHYLEKRLAPDSSL